MGIRDDYLDCIDQKIVGKLGITPEQKKYIGLFARKEDKNLMVQIKLSVWGAHEIYLSLFDKNTGESPVEYSVKDDGSVTNSRISGFDLGTINDKVLDIHTGSGGQESIDRYITDKLNIKYEQKNLLGRLFQLEVSDALEVSLTLDGSGHKGMKIKVGGMRAEPNSYDLMTYLKRRDFKDLRFKVNNPNIVTGNERIRFEFDYNHGSGIITEDEKKYFVSPFGMGRFLTDSQKKILQNIFELRIAYGRDSVQITDTPRRNKKRLIRLSADIPNLTEDLSEFKDCLLMHYFPYIAYSRLKDKEGFLVNSPENIQTIFRRIPIEIPLGLLKR